MLATLQGLVAPSLAFHAAVESSSRDDVRFLWEVKAIRGKDEFFAQVSGVSTMPGLLADSQLHIVVERVGAEMISKIAAPMSGKFQDLSNKKALEFLVADRPAPRAPRVMSAPERDLSIEAELIMDQET